MDRIFRTVVKFFQDENWPYEQLDESPILVLECEGENGRWHCLAEVRERESQFLFYSLCPYDIPVELIQPMESFISRANFGLIIGNFEIDSDEGEVRYKTSIDTSGSRLDAPLIRQLVYANVITMDRYLPGILMVIDGKFSAEEAIDRIESPAGGSLSV
jgi:hypothetical protein